MTDLENFLAATDHRRPERVLYYADFTDDLKRRVVEHVGTDRIGEHYGFLRRRAVQLEPPADRRPPDFSPWWHGRELPPGTTINSMGVARAPSGFYHFTSFISPLTEATSLRQIEEYPIEDCAGWRTEHMAAAVADAHAAGEVAVGWAGHMYEDAWQIRGYEQFLMDLIERPAWAECLLERLAERNMNRSLAAARAGVHWLRCGDDVANQNAMMFAPATWRKLMLSRWAKVWRAVRDVHPGIRIWYHSDGNIEPIVGELIEAGVNILNPLQPECLDLADLHRRYGGRVTFDGCIGTQSTMPWGTPQQVEARVGELIEAFGRRGGLILSPTHVLEPEVPLANIDAFAGACRRLGQFG